MNMKWMLGAGLALLAAIGVARADAGEPEFELVAVGTIEVAPDGSVHDYALRTDLDPDVARLVDGTVRGWHFEPVLVGGRPVIATTRMRLRLEALPRDDGYALRVADVTFGEPEAGANLPPEYPRDALSRGIGAKVSLVLQVAPEGRVVGMHVEQVDLTERLGKRGNRIRELFADASRKAAAGWTFDTGEIIDGEPVAMRIRVPVDFSLVNANGWTKRPTYHPGPYMPSPWTTPRDPAVPDTSLAQGDLQPLDESRLKLRDVVVGTLL